MDTILHLFYLIPVQFFTNIESDYVNRNNVTCLWVWTVIKKDIKVDLVNFIILYLWGVWLMFIDAACDSEEESDRC